MQLDSCNRQLHLAPRASMDIFFQCQSTQCTVKSLVVTDGLIGKSVNLEAGQSGRPRLWGEDAGLLELTDQAPDSSQYVKVAEVILSNNITENFQRASDVTSDLGR